MRNSHGNDNSGVRKFLREIGVKPNVANVERMQREVSRSQTERERVQRIAKETGRGGTYDRKGEVHARVREAVQREMRNRQR